MKTFATTKHFISVLSLLLALVMCFSACGGGEEKVSPDGGNDVSATDTTDTASGDEVTDTTKEDVSSKQDTTNNSSSTASKNNNKGGTTVTGKTVWDKDYLKTMPASVKKKGLSILMWREMHPTEQKLLDDFVKKTGCKVEKIITTEKEYSTKLISLIAGRKSPDICYIVADNFPSIVMKSMQPLDAKQFRLDDKCWNKQYMDYYTINGKYYSVAMNGAWNCDDCLNVTYYLPSVLKDAGVKTMPYDLWKEGKWNWDTQYDILAKMKRAGKGGISLHSFDMFMLSAGLDFMTYDGKKFKSAIDEKSDTSLMVKAWQTASRLRFEELGTAWELKNVQQGKIGLFTSIAYGMWKEGDWGFQDVPGGPNAIEVVPVAGPKGGTAYTPARPKTWGVPKGAQNVEGAAYFLRYWLDVNNCDMDSTFLNKQCKEVYNIITKNSHKKQVRVSGGVLNYGNEGSYEDLCWALYATASANTLSVLNSNKGKVASAVTRINRDLAKIR